MFGDIDLRLDVPVCLFKAYGTIVVIKLSGLVGAVRKGGLHTCRCQWNLKHWSMVVKSGSVYCLARNMRSSAGSGELGTNKLGGELVHDVNIRGLHRWTARMREVILTDVE